REAQTLREEFGLTGDMVGKSAAIERVREMIARIAPSEARVLVMGESGTGKELVAAAIHYGSPRRDKPFVRVNCAAIPRDLVESEMFGHERGAFTGATDRRIGRFELADQGTLFMDEVGDLGAEAQAKLLRAIEAKEIERVGGGKPIPVNVRIVAATNKDLEKNVADGSFREDLYFRLNVIPMQLPPLRDRVDDIDALVLHFSTLGRARGYPAPRWTAGALDLMRRYRWPGNVRELANIVERLGILHAGTEVTASDVGAVLAIGRTTPPSGAPAAADTDKPLGDALDDYERELISQALTAANGNVAEAARRLRTDRPNLYRRMRRLSIEWNGA
ncbi:MAG TPA: sigma-54 dependent transcriptional regulator, partial [Gemmatimonadaceae bacterium]|nr:sigma-54 dependent transcriptional regulator [Gemmatimonadaceae bacterium]